MTAFTFLNPLTMDDMATLNRLQVTLEADNNAELETAEHYENTRESLERDTKDVLENDGVIHEDTQHDHTRESKVAHSVHSSNQGGDQEALLRQSLYVNTINKGGNNTKESESKRQENQARAYAASQGLIREMSASSTAVGFEMYGGAEEVGEGLRAKAMAIRENAVEQINESATELESLDNTEDFLNKLENQMPVFGDVMVTEDELNIIKHHLSPEDAAALDEAIKYSTLSSWDSFGSSGHSFAIDNNAFRDALHQARESIEERRQEIEQEKQENLQKLEDADTIEENAQKVEQGEITCVGDMCAPAIAALQDEESGDVQNKAHTEDHPNHDVEAQHTPVAGPTAAI